MHDASPPLWQGARVGLVKKTGAAARAVLGRGWMLPKTRRCCLRCKELATTLGLGKDVYSVQHDLVAQLP